MNYDKISHVLYFPVFMFVVCIYFSTDSISVVGFKGFSGINMCAILLFPQQKLKSTKFEIIALLMNILK